MNTLIMKSRMALITVFFAIWAGILTGCHRQTTTSDIQFDSLMIDTVYKLTDSKSSPTLTLQLHLTYAKGKGSQIINRQLARELFSQGYSDKHTPSMPQVVNKFATQILHTYRQDYAAMHREDVENDSAYNLRYALHSATVFSEKAVTYCLYRQIRQGGYQTRQVTTLCFDPKTKRLLSLNNLIPAPYTKDAKAEIVEKLCRKFNVDNEQQLADLSITFNESSDYPSNFILHDDGITVIFNQDEIAPHSFGEIRIKIKRY